MKNNNQQIRRGDIFYYDFGVTKGSIQSGVRPVLVLQCNEGNAASPTVIVAAMTTSHKKAYLPSHIILNDTYGLREPSMVLLEQISVINKCNLERYIGNISDQETVKQIDIALEKVLGIKPYKPRVHEEVRCLCKKCLNDYKASPLYKVRRINPYTKVKEPCDKCNGMGYDYAISERRFPEKRGVRNV